MISYITAGYMRMNRMAPPKEPNKGPTFGDAPNPNRIADIALPKPKPKKDVKKPPQTPPVQEKKGFIERTLDFFA